MIFNLIHTILICSWFIIFQDENSTLFLVAAYARYSSPYVWVRSNHQRIVELSGEHDKDKDNPLKLKSTQKWLKDGMITMSHPPFLSRLTKMNIRQKQTCAFC